MSSCGCRSKSLSVARPCSAPPRNTVCSTPGVSKVPYRTRCAPAETVGGGCQSGSNMTQIVETENLLRYDPCLSMQPGIYTMSQYM